MTNDDNLTLSALIRTFRSELREALPDLTFQEVLEPDYSLTLESKPSPLGSLSVYFDSEEITVTVGPHHHSHFSLYMYNDLQPDEAILEIAGDAVEYIRDILEDRRVFGVILNDGRVTGSYDYHIGHEPSSGRASQQYVWSGLLKPQDD